MIRAAAVYVAVLFLPLALASLAWPAIAHWCRRLVDTLVALVLGKFVIVSVLSLAAGALAGGTGSGSAGGSGSPGSPGAGHPGGGGFAAVLGGAALLLFAAFAPWALFRLLPFLEAGAVGHLESLSHRAHQSAGAPARGLARTAMQATGAGSVAGAASGSVGGLVGGLGRAGLGGAGGGRSGGAGGSGGPGGGLGELGGGLGGGPAGTESDPGGEDPPGTRPDPGPSSAESTGVGTTESPGQGIPAWAIHPQATATARRSSGVHGAGGRAGTTDSGGRPPLGAGTDASAPFGPAGTSGSSGPGGSSAVASADGDPGYVKHLPRPMGTNLTDTLGRDRLGVRLISRTIEPEAQGRPVTPPQNGPTGPGTGDGT